MSMNPALNPMFAAVTAGARVDKRSMAIILVIAAREQV